jgi:hypothetical protein
MIQVDRIRKGVLTNAPPAIVVSVGKCAALSASAWHAAVQPKYGEIHEYCRCATGIDKRPQPHRVVGASQQPNLRFPTNATVHPIAGR